MVITLSRFTSVLLYFLVFLVSSEMSKKRTNRCIQVILISSLPILIGGIRYYVGGDYGGYLALFNEASDKSIADYFKGFNFWDDPLGFYLLTKVVSFFGSSFLFFVITSALSYIPVILYVLKDWEYSGDKYSIASRSFFIYLINFYIFGFAAIRQGIAIGFCFYSLTYVFERKPIKFVILVFISALFHSTALVFLPVYFLWSKSGKLNRWKRIVAIFTCFLFIYGLDYFIEIIGGRYSGYTSEVFGTNFTFWIMLMWSIIFLVFRKALLKVDVRNELLILIFVVGTILQFLGFTNAFTKRIGQYFLVSQCLLLPQLTSAFTQNSRTIAWWLIVAFELLLFIIQFAVLGQSNIVPYSFII